jgi:hypothetical protein
LQRRFDEARQVLAWCVAVRVMPIAVSDLSKRLDAALQSRDVEELLRLAASARAMLPRARDVQAPPTSDPVADGDCWLFDNGIVRARVHANGALTECALADGFNIAAPANVAVVNAGRWRGIKHAKAVAGAAVDGALDLHLVAGGAKIAMRVELRSDEPFLRVDAAAAGAGVLRMEHRFAASRVALCGPRGERCALVRADAAALAVFALDGADWKVRELPKGGVAVDAPIGAIDDDGIAASWAFAPLPPAAGKGEAEALWQRFAYETRVRLFQSTDYGILVESCGPAEDGDGVTVTVRECEGKASTLRVRCGGRMRAAEGAAIEQEYLVAPIGANETREIRVRF